jgi:hypothetical protein
MTLSLHIVLPLVAFFVALYTVMRVVRYRAIRWHQASWC